MKTVDVGAVLDQGDWSVYQKLLVAATALTIILDGFDNQLLGGAVPSLMREWHLARAAFSPVLTSGFVGMVFGGFLGGYLGDRMGRRVALLSSLLAFGLLTLLIAFSGSLLTLGVLRFFAGLGLGGAMPNAAALSSEYVPRRHRPFAVTLTIVCIPLGGTLAGLVGAQILPRFGWQMLFRVGGIIPFFLAVALFKILPESPRFLARHKERWRELVVLLRRLGHNVTDDAAFVDASEKTVAHSSAREIFVPEYRRDTLVLCACFFFCLLSVYMGTTWVPSLLTAAKFDVGTASYGLSAFNLGGVLGAILGAIAIGRLGSRFTMLTMTAGAVAGAAVMAVMPIGPSSAMAVLVMLGWTGGLINAVQTTMYALAAHVYPTGIRATGVGTAVGFGRLGGVASPYTGNWAIESGGPSWFFGLVAVTMTLVFVALASVRRHIPRVSSLRAAGSVPAVQPASH